jgi:lysozyme
MKISEKGLSLIKQWEGLRLKAYRDAAGILTIGYGHTGPDVVEGMTITQEQADALLRKDIEKAERAVSTLVKVPLTQEQFDSIVSFVFNCGVGAFQRSTLLKKLNAGDYDGAAAEFDKWVYITRGGQKVKLSGLVKRRAAERALFESRRPA